MRGKALTPFLLGAIARTTASRSLAANRALVLNNGRVRVYKSTIDGTTAAGVRVANANAIIESSTFRNIGTSGVSITGGPIVSGTLPAPGTSTVQVVDSLIEAFVGIQGSAPNAGDQIYLTANQNRLISSAGGNGIKLLCIMNGISNGPVQ